MGINVNNINTPVHIGTRSIRRGTISNNKLRGLKINKSQQNEIEMSTVQRSTINTLNTDLSNELHKLFVLASFIGVENMDMENIEIATNKLNDLNIKADVLSFMKPFFTNYIQNRRNVIGLQVEKSKLEYYIDVRTKELRLTMKDLENLKLSKEDIELQRDSFINERERLLELVEIQKKEIEILKSTPCNTNLEEELKRKEEEIKKLKSQKTSSQEVLKLQKEIDDKQLIIDELRTSITPGSKEEQLQKCMEKLRALKERLGVTRDPLTVEFKHNEPKDLGKLLILIIFLSQALEQEELTLENKSFNFMKELAKPGDKKQFAENAYKALFNFMKLSGINITIEEIEEHLIRIDEKWFDFTPAKFRFFKDSLLQEVMDAISSSNITKQISTIENIAPIVKDTFKEVYDIVLPFIPVNGRIVDLKNRVPQIALYMAKLHQSNPDVELNTIFRFSEKIHKILLQFKHKSVIDAIVNPEFEKTEIVSKKVGEDANFKPIIKDVNTNVSFFTRVNEINHLIDSLDSISDRGMLFAIVYTVLKMRDRAILAGTPTGKWEFGKVVSRIKILSKFRLTTALNEESEAIVINPFEDSTSFVNEIINSFNGINPPSGEINILVGKTIVNEIDYYELVQNKFRNDISERPSETKKLQFEQVEIKQEESEEEVPIVSVTVPKAIPEQTRRIPEFVLKTEPGRLNLNPNFIDELNNIDQSKNVIPPPPPIAPRLPPPPPIAPRPPIAPSLNFLEQLQAKRPRIE